MQQVIHLVLEGAGPIQAPLAWPAKPSRVKEK